MMDLVIGKLEISCFLYGYEQDDQDGSGGGKWIHRHGVATFVVDASEC